MAWENMCKGADSLAWGQGKLLIEVISKWRTEGLVGIGQAKGRWEWAEIKSKEMIS